MKNRIRVTLVLALLCAALSTAMSASDNAYLYLVHGIPGLDYSAGTDPTFPVDILLNDEVCAVHGLTYGTIFGPFTFAAGSYDIKISVANTLAPCSNSPIVDSTVKLDSGQNLSAVFTLSSTATPTLDTFTNDFASVDQNDGRILFALAADSPAVQVILQNTTTQKIYTYSVNPGTLLKEILPADTYTVEVNEGTTTLVPSTTIVLYSQSATLLYALGESSNNSVQMETRTVRNVF
jgi:hypothetical protein